ncbi:hypothetical protein FBUS_09745 [Fasciolopsis buskii]|uniref:RNase NYN domain-containing protein n=1 Tax=Fasciolopsis buskii TaxID=27845 RepID=A0A8E0RXY6_9TREM|nr:hypothetical protein FBUS_09745 [Fasciolopsis buski]
MKKFSPQGVHLAVDFFLKRGHTDVIAVVPRFRQGKGGDLFDDLEKRGNLTYSPSRIVDNEQQVADDDRSVFILSLNLLDRTANSLVVFLILRLPVGM